MRMIRPYLWCRLSWQWYLPRLQRPAFPKPPMSRHADREAISTVLSAQQMAWNRGDVDAFLVGIGIRRN